MAGAALIVFRETLEAALVIAVVLGATRGVAGRARWVLGGIILGIAGASGVAGFAGMIADAAEGRGQELLNAGVLLAAVAMLAWHSIWMSGHGRRIAADVKQVGRDVSAGGRPLSAVALVAFFAVLREGSETVLFLYGLLATGTGHLGLAAGGALGIGGGLAVGWLLYRGLLAIPVGAFMSAMSWLILLLAAGLAANAAGFLNQAGLVPALAPQVWDSSRVLSQESWLGTLLHILVGYHDRPMGIQLVFYVATLAVISALAHAVALRTARTRAGRNQRRS